MRPERRRRVGRTEGAQPPATGILTYAGMDARSFCCCCERGHGCPRKGRSEAEGRLHGRRRVGGLWVESWAPTIEVIHRKWPPTTGRKLTAKATGDTTGFRGVQIPRSLGGQIPRNRGCKFRATGGPNSAWISRLVHRHIHRWQGGRIPRNPASWRPGRRLVEGGLIPRRGPAGTFRDPRTGDAGPDLRGARFRAVTSRRRPESSQPGVGKGECECRRTRHRLWRWGRSPARHASTSRSSA